MKIVLGFGNDLRGEDGFGIDVIKELEKHQLNNTKLISAFQLTPEISLELLDASKIIFVDAAFSETSNYSIACSIEQAKQNNLSHHISIKTVISILENIYNMKVEYEVFSMLTNSFEKINDIEKYTESINKVVSFIKKNS